MSNKVMIIGTGNVGASIGFSLASQRTPVNELVLVDIDQADAEGEAMDLRDTLAVSPTYLKISAGSYEKDARDTDIAIFTAGAAQKKGGETRIELLARNERQEQVERPLEDGEGNGEKLELPLNLDRVRQRRHGR